MCGQFVFSSKMGHVSGPVLSDRVVVPVDFDGFVSVVANENALTVSHSNVVGYI